MELDKYIENKLQQFVSTHPYSGYLNIQNDRELQRKWKNEQSQRDLLWRQITCNDDVFSLIDRFDGSVSFVEKHVEIGHIEDGFNMALALYRALLGIKKLSQFCLPRTYHTTNFTPLSVEEVDFMFNRLDSIYTRMQEQNTKRAMQD